jgi:hypothetical protein
VPMSVPWYYKSQFQGDLYGPGATGDDQWGSWITRDDLIPQWYLAMVSQAQAENQAASQGSSPPTMPMLRLVPKSDYCGGGDRHILYRIQTLNSNNTLGAIPSTTWYVTEHQTVKALAPPNGMTTDDRANQFDDWISGAGQNPVKSIQTFTISQALSGRTKNYSIIVRMGTQDYGSLGIYTSNPPIVQGVQCPASLVQ